MNFVAIDFETATGYRNSTCAVGIVTVENGEIVDEYCSLIQPPENNYSWHNTNIHGIRSRDTEHTAQFLEVYPTIKKLIANKIVVAHNESFDRSVLKNTMNLYGLNYSELNLADRWECTLRIYRAKGFIPAGLDACCNIMNIELNHHEALSDARACAKLYLMK